MLCGNYTKEMLGFEDVIINVVEEKDNILHIHLKMEQRIHTCPNCGERFFVLLQLRPWTIYTNAWWIGPLKR